MEVKFISYFEASSQGLWLKNFIAGIQIVDSISKPIKVYYDNSAAVFLAKMTKVEVEVSTLT